MYEAGRIKEYFLGELAGDMCPIELSDGGLVIAVLYEGIEGGLVDLPGNDIVVTDPGLKGRLQKSHFNKPSWFSFPQNLQIIRECQEFCVNGKWLDFTIKING